MSAVRSFRIRSVGAVLFVAGAVAVAGCGSDDDGNDGGGKPAEAPTVRSTLTLERFPSPSPKVQDLVVSLTDARLNTPQTARGKTSVLLTCLAAGGDEAVRRQVPWPLVVEAGFLPHVHELLRPGELDRIRSCRLTAAGLELSGRVTGKLPLTGP